MNVELIEPCAACGEPVDWSAGPHEFVRADGSSAVVCADCCDIIAENTAHDTDDQDDDRASATTDTPDDATSGKSATWPAGEPAGVRDLARRLDIARRADDLAARLDRDLGNVRDERLAGAVRATIEGLRALSAACPTADEDMILRAAEHAHTALCRCEGLAAEVERGGA